MAESELGVASLRIVVDTSAALSALAQFRTRFANEIDDLGTINFRGVERGAAEAGQRAGRAIRDGITNATANLRFDNIREALDFSDALNGTLRDLRQYREALVALREVTPATAAGFGQLNDVIEAAGQAIRNYSAGTDQLQDSARRINLRELNAQLREQRQEAAANARVDREWADAIRTIESAQRGAATATRLANQAFRDQIGLVGTLAQKGARDIAKTVGGVGKGVAAAAKGAVNLGKFGYELGAEFGVFEAPRTGPIKDAIQQVADRFKFLGEQAQTTRGIILRAIEAAGTSAGLVELARNADLLKAALGGVDGAAQVASKGLGILDKVGGGFFNFLSNRFPDTAFGEFARLASGATDVAAGIGSATSSLTNFASQGLGASLDGLQALIAALGSVPPEAQAAVLALAGLSLGFKEKPIVEGLNRVLEYLDGLSSKALKVRGDLSTVFKELGQFQEQLSKANSQTLLPAFKERGFTRLDDPENGALTESVQLADRYRRLTEAIGSNWERGARFLEKSTAEIERQIQLGIRQGPSNVFANGGTPAVANPQQYARPIGPVAAPPPALSAEQQQSFRRNQLLDDLADVTGRRVAAEQALLSLQEASRKLEQRNLAKQTEIQRVRDALAVSTGRASPIDGNLGQDRFGRDRRVPGSPADLADRRRRRNDAIGSAVIGGAFPLLFGQGLGASVGGGLGGLAGGAIGGQFGFGLSLVGTALGAQFDKAIQGAELLAKALDDPIANFQQLAEQGLISSKATEKLIKGLIESGQAAEAQARIQQDLIETFGSAQGARRYRDAVDTLNRSWQQATTILGAFVAGPLADLIRSLSDPKGNFGAAVQFEQLAAELTPEQLARVRKVSEEATRRSARSRGGFNAAVPDAFVVPSENDVAAGRKAGIREARLILGIEEQRAEAAARVAAAQVQNQRALSNSYRLIDAQVQGYERETLERQKQQVLDERNRKLLELPQEQRTGSPQARVIEQEAAKRIYEITQQITELDQRRWAQGIAAANQIKSIQEQTAIEAARPGLTGIGVGALQAVAALREARRQEQNAQASLRVTPGDLGLRQQAEQAAANVKLAAAKTKSDLLDAYKAAQDAVRNISRGIEDAVTALQAARGGSDGVNALISPQQRLNRQKEARAQLGATANELASQLGVNITRLQPGSLAQENRQLADFIQAARSELRGTQDIGLAQGDLNKAFADLSTVQRSLLEVNSGLIQSNTNVADQLSALAAKDWAVSVNVDSSGRVQTFGDVLNSAVQ